MKCQKCGADLVSGHLYCDICGAEYQIVPDFEPEIENSIAESLSDIRVDINDDISVKEQKSADKTQKNKRPSLGIIFFGVMVVFACLFFVYFRYTNSAEYQEKQAMAAVEQEDYYRAAQIYEKIRKRNAEDAYWYVKEAECKLIIGEEGQAYRLALQAVEQKIHRETAYDFLLSYLEKKENYMEMKQYLGECEFEEVCNKYWEYSGRVPEANYESGTYDHSLFLTFDDGYEGTIYYTLDGTIPDKTSLIYEAPIPLGNGTHVVTVMYGNKVGIFGNPEVYEYQIFSDIPLAPIVMPDSGSYTDAQRIEVDVEEGTRVFYTTDLSLPSMESTEYTEPIPLSLGESNYNFVAYSSNGTGGEITTRSFVLNMKTTVSVEEAKNLLIQKLISTGHILDSNGAVKDRYGVFGYFYKYPIYESGSNYYVFEEHYLENQIKNPLGNFYGVNVISKDIYKLVRNADGNFSKIHF